MVLLRDARFIGLTAIGGFGIAGFFIYLANSSFVQIGHYGLSFRQYSLAFSVNAASFIGASQFAGRLAARHGLPKVVSVAVAVSPRRWSRHWRLTWPASTAWQC